MINIKDESDVQIWCDYQEETRQVSADFFLRFRFSNFYTFLVNTKNFGDDATSGNGDGDGEGNGFGNNDGDGKGDGYGWGDGEGNGGARGGSCCFSADYCSIGGDGWGDGDIDEIDSVRLGGW